MERKKIYKILSLFLIMQWAFVQIVAQFPLFIETYYSNGVFPLISRLLRFTLGWIPFSVGDVLYATVIIYILKSGFKLLKTKKLNIKYSLLKLGGIISIVYFLFHLNWGLNYYRVPIAEKFEFSKSQYSKNELILLTNQLITKVNSIQLGITKNDTTIVENPSTKKQINNLAAGAYTSLEEIYPDFAYKNTSVKSSLFSLPLSYMGFAGYISPLTNEAQVNYLIPKNSYASTTCHEIAHQIGIASEKEANFIGYLAAINSDNVYLNYSGYLMAVRYCLGEIYRLDDTAFETMKQKLNKGILKDLKQNQDFWMSYQNWSEQFFKIFYDSYLKANKQDDGIKGYNQVVLLFVNYYQENPV